MKRRRVTLTQLRGEIRMLEMILAGLVARDGGTVHLSKDELETVQGQLILNAGPDGAHLQLMRRVQVAGLVH